MAGAGGARRPCGNVPLRGLEQPSAVAWWRWAILDVCKCAEHDLATAHHHKQMVTTNYYGENNTAAVGGIGDNNPSDDNQSPTTGVFGHFFSRLRLLSLFGWTLGGVFVVEWQDSPIGYYREVAVLSGLIARGFEIGAWASHIVVSSDAAVDTGRRVFGLPAYKGSIDYMATNAPKTSSAEAGDRSREKSRSLGFDEERNRQIETQFSKGGGVFEFLSDNTIRVWGWDNWLLADNKMRQNTTLSGGSSLSASLSSSIQSDDCGPERVDQGSNGGLNLPSFSGLLSMDDSETECEKYTPLLRYPLRLMRPRRVRLRPGFSIFVPQHQPEMGKQLKREMTNSAEQISLSDDVRDVLEGEREILFGAPAEAAITALLPCIQFDGVDVIAGVPDVL
eukprot:jgi/Bigna1/70813/fgenesh1_pg.13_\